MIYLVDDKLPVEIHTAARRAENFFYSLTVEDIEKVHPFTFYDGGPESVHKKIQCFRLTSPYPVVAWYPKWRFTRAVATTFGDGAIHINVHKIGPEMILLREEETTNWLGRKKVKKIWGWGTPVHSYVNTLVHEALHNIGFGHGPNNYVTREALRSVNYAVGALAESWSRSIG